LLPPETTKTERGQKKEKEKKRKQRKTVAYRTLLYPLMQSTVLATSQSHMARQRDPSCYSVACHICRTLTSCTLPRVGPKSQILNSHQIEPPPHLTLDIYGSLTILRYALQISKIVDAADAAGPFFLVSSSDLVANQDCSTHTPPKSWERILLRQSR